MTGYSLDRRQFLQATCASAAVGVAGCLAPGGNNFPAYTDWIPEETGSQKFAYIDFDVTVEEQDDGAAFPLFYPAPLGETADSKRVRVAQGELENPDDPMLALPVETGGVLLLSAVLGLGVPGLGYLADPAAESGVNELMGVGGVILALGDIDVERAEEQLGESGPGEFARAFEPAGELDEFTLYEPAETEADDGPGVVAVSSSAAMLAESRAKVETMTDTANGDHGRAVEESQRFGRLADAVGDGDLIVGWQGPVDLDDLRFESSDAETVHDVFLSEDDVLSAVTFSPGDDEVAVDLAVHNDSLPGRADRFESVLGAAADDRSLSVDDDRITATGTYEDVSFERVDPEGEDDGVEQEKLPEEVAGAVPEDAFTFEYDAQQEAVRVEIVETFEAEEVRVVSVNSDWEAAIDTARAGTWLNAYVDPEGDTVRVIVTVDGVSGVVATREVP